MLSLSLNSNNLEGKKTGPNFGNILNHSWFYSFTLGFKDHGQVSALANTAKFQISFQNF